MNQTPNKSSLELLKEIPSIDELCKILEIEKYPFPTEILKKELKKTVASIRKKIIANEIVNNIKKIVLDKSKECLIKNTSFGIDKVINGTGIVLHTGFGRAPISKEIFIESFEKIYPYSNLEFDVHKNKRGDRNLIVQNLINPLVGSQSCLVVNNCAAALLLTLNSLSENSEVVISRGQQVEIGGSFRIPEIIKKAGCQIKDVGTTNKTHAQDFIEAISSKTGVLLYAHTSNYRVVGFTNEISVFEMSKIAKKNKIPLVVDAGSGCITKFEKFDMPTEKLNKSYFKDGADIVMFSGDKLLGGPQCGIIAGKKKYIDIIKKNSLYRVLRADKLTFSILDSILRTYKSNSKFLSENLALKLLTRTRGDLEKFITKLLDNLGTKIVKKYGIEVITTKVEAGSGAMPINSIKSSGITFDSRKITPNKISKKFRNCSTPIIGHIKENRFIIDFKAIPDDCFENLLKTFREVLK